jgi:hypothetical protein
VKAVFFSPYSFIWLHAFPEALIVEALQKNGFDITYLTCGKLFESWCVAMESTGLDESISIAEKQAICRKCEDNKRKLLNHFTFPEKSLHAYLTVEDEEKISTILGKLSANTVFDLMIDELPVGRAALYNYVINHKKTRQNLDSGDWPALSLHLHAILRSFFAGKRMLAQEKPDLVVFYSSSYSINLVVKLQAEKAGIKCFSIYAGSNWDTRIGQMHVATSDSFTQFENRAALWENQFGKLPATRGGLRSAFIQQKALFLGQSTFVYGGGLNRPATASLKNKFGILPEQKILFAATSSYDELMAAQTIGAIPELLEMAFPDQISWLKATIDFVANRSDLFLIIRIHPREFPNRREKNASKHSEMLLTLMKTLPENVRVNTPDDNLSLYDFLEIIDLGLTSWSSAGKEFATWGIPNLSYVPSLSFYPKKELGYVASTEAEYFQQLDLALQRGFSEERIERAYRWLAYELEEGVFDLTDSIKLNVLKKPSLFFRIRNRLRKRGVSPEERWLLYHRRPLPNGKLIAERFSFGTSVEETMLPHRLRLSVEKEKKIIRSIVRDLAKYRFGKHWGRAGTKSPLQNFLSNFLENKY